MIIIDGQIVDSDKMREVTQEEYDALSDDQKTDGTTYYITDDGMSDYSRLLNLLSLVGNQDGLNGKSDGTIVGAIVDLYNRLGGLSFRVDSETNHLQAIYDNTTTEVTIEPIPSEFPSDTERLKYLEKLVGDSSGISALGYSNIVEAILDIYKRINDLSFEYNEVEETITVTHDESLD